MTIYTHLVVSDTNNVIDYIFASNQYKFIRGASLLLDHLNTTAATQLIKQFNGRSLSAGGGEARVLFQQEADASNYTRALHTLYQKQTDQVTISSAIVARHQPESMAAWLERGEQELRLAEITFGKKQIQQIAIAPFMKRCESCNQRVAEKTTYTNDNEILAICLSCAHKKEQLEHVIQQVTNRSTEAYSGLSEVHQRLAQKDDAATSWVPSIDGLFEDDLTGNRIGFVYADGKGIGSLFKQVINDKHLNDEEFITMYTERSTNLHNALIEAAVETHKKLEQIGYTKSPVDYALIGGDDLAAILPGKLALLYTYYLLQFFEEKTKAYFGRSYHLAAGVIIAKKRYPIHQLFNLSYDLMTRTKQQNDSSSLDFQVILDSYVQSLDHKRSDSPIDDKRHLYTEGYTLNKADDASFMKMYNLACQLKKEDFPSSKMKGIYQITTETNDVMLQFKWKEWLSRLDKTHRKILLDSYPELAVTPFCITKNQTKYTPIRDLFDIYDLIEKEATIV